MFLVYDPVGRYVHIAQGIARTDDVMYFSPTRQGAADPFDYLPGMGLRHITRTNDPFEDLNSVDCFVFPGVGDCYLQEYLRANGHAVFGAGKYSLIEQDRLEMRRKADDFELVRGTAIIGTDTLRDYLQATDDCYIKISFLRGIMETFHHINYKVTEVWLDNLVQKLGPYASLAEFIVEDPINEDLCVEVGVDTFVCDGSSVENHCWGYEVKDAFHAATTAALPPKLQRSLDHHLAMIPDYRGAISNELRVVPKHEYLIDVTHRFGLPPSQLQSAWIENFADVIYGIATGDVVEPEYRAPIGVQITITSEWFQLHPLAIECEYPDRVFFYGQCSIEGQTYAINVLRENVENLVEIGAAVGWGNTLEKAIANAVEAAEGVSGLYVGINKGNMTKGLEAIKDGNKLGLDWGGSTKLPMED